MLRKGRFAVMDGKEYELFSSQRQYYLKSTNILDLANGFAAWPGKKDVFMKKINTKDLEDAYEVFPYVIVSSHRFMVEAVNYQTGMVTLVTSNPFVQGKMNVKPYRVDEYVIECPIVELKIEEERIPILDFENEHPFSYEPIKEVK